MPQMPGFNYSAPGAPTGSDFYKMQMPTRAPAGPSRSFSLPLPKAPTFNPQVIDSTTRNRGGSGTGVDFEGPTSTSTSSQTTKANRSPELDASIAAMEGRIGDLRTGYEGAFQGYQDSFNDTLRYLADAYRSQGSGSAQAAAQSGLAGGLSPMEAQALSTNQWMGALRDLYPQMANIRQEQSRVPIERMNAMQGVETSLGMPLLSQVQSPYLRDVAGSQTQGRQDVTDRLGIEKLRLAEEQMESQKMSDLNQLNLNRWQTEMDAAMRQAQMDQSRDLAMRQLSSRDAESQRDYGLNRSRLNQQSDQFDQSFQNTMQQMGAQQQFQAEQANLDRQLSFQNTMSNVMKSIETAQINSASKSKPVELSQDNINSFISFLNQ